MKASGLVFLLVAAVLMLPIRNVPHSGFVTESPRTVCGDSSALSEAAPHSAADSGIESGGDTVQIIVAVVVIIIIVYFISCIADTGSQ
jgi:hypothetical protein